MLLGVVVYDAWGRASGGPERMLFEWPYCITLEVRSKDMCSNLGESKPKG
jgi:hypothetical protein